MIMVMIVLLGAGELRRHGAPAAVNAAVNNSRRVVVKRFSSGMPQSPFPFYIECARMDRASNSACLLPAFPVARTRRNLPSFCLALQLRRPPASTDFLPPKIDATPSACFYYRFQLTRGLSANVLRQVM